MAAGEIKYVELERGYNETDGYFIHGMLMFNYNSAYTIHDDSVRVYYTTNPDEYSSNEPHVDLVPPDSEATGDNILKADTWQAPYQVLLPKMIVMFNTPVVLGLTNAKYKVSFTIKHLSMGVTYYTRAWLRLYKSPTASKVALKYHDPPGDTGERKKITMLAAPGYRETKMLFGIAKYTPASQGSDNYVIEYEDFTECIKLPSYNVNSDDVNEDWEDANYETHRIVARKKITGKFEMIFPSMQRQKEFFNYIEISKQLNGNGIAYVDLKLQVNNVFEIRAGETIADAQPLLYEGRFFIKIDNNAWVQPIYGHYDKYSPLSITVTEV